MSNLDFLVGVMLYASINLAVSLRVIAKIRMEFNMKAAINFLFCVVVGTALLGRPGLAWSSATEENNYDYLSVVKYIGESAGGFNSLLAPPAT